MAASVQDLPTTQEILQTTTRLVESHRADPGGLIPVLQEVQRAFGYLPAEALHAVSSQLDVPYSEVAGVVTFYSYFTTVPRGLHIVRVCLGTACYVRGGQEVLGAVSRELGIDVGETTEDRLFSLEVGRCFGACGLAPVLMVGDNVHQRVTPTCVPEILSQYRESVEEVEDEG